MATMETLHPEHCEAVTCGQQTMLSGKKLACRLQPAHIGTHRADYTTGSLRVTVEWPLLSKTAHRRTNRIRTVAARDGYRCWYCLRPFTDTAEVTFDHEVPLSLGGTDALANLRLACGPCNASKGGVHGPDSFKPGDLSRPKQPVLLYPDRSPT